MSSLTAPLAIIKVNNIQVGFIRNLNINESHEISPIYGIGNLTPQELPVVKWSGTMTAESYLIDFYKAINVLTDASVVQRVVTSADQFIDTVLLNDDGVTLDIYRKVEQSRNASGAVTSELEIFASVRGCKMTRDGISISDGQIAGRNVEFMYKTPIFKLA